MQEKHIPSHETIILDIFISSMPSRDKICFHFSGVRAGKRDRNREIKREREREGKEERDDINSKNMVL